MFLQPDMNWIGHLEGMWNASCTEGDMPRGERCSSWENDRFSTSHETLNLLWKLTVHWPPSYSLSSVHIWARWTHSTLSQFLRFWDLFSLKFCMHFWYFPCVVRSFLVSAFWFVAVFFVPKQCAKYMLHYKLSARDLNEARCGMEQYLWTFLTHCFVKKP